MLGQTGFTDYSYKIGSAAVQKKEIKSKPKVAAAEEWKCSDEIYCKESMVGYQKQVLKLFPRKISAIFRSKL